jgi:homoserine O-acetyltransferase
MEYKTEQKTFVYQRTLELESGIVLPGFQLAYTSMGELNVEKTNVLWVFHALTANSNVMEWWPGLVGSNKVIDPHKYFIICVNMPGSCYGSIGPLSNDPSVESYFHTFPFFTTRDMANAYKLLKDDLGITKIAIGMGGSMGGQQLLEWAILEPELFNVIVPLATNAKHSPWGIAFNATQRLAIEQDSTWKSKETTAGVEGMKVARSIALISYRHYDTYLSSQTDNDANKLENYKSESYQRYQGEKLATRFNAFSYYFLSKSMDAHNVGRKRVSVINALNKITAKTLVIGITTDVLFPIQEQIFLFENITDAKLELIESPYGHDGFLTEGEKINDLILNFINSN